MTGVPCALDNTTSIYINSNLRILLPKLMHSSSTKYNTHIYKPLFSIFWTHCAKITLPYPVVAEMYVVYIRFCLPLDHNDHI